MAPVVEASWASFPSLTACPLVVVVEDPSEDFRREVVAALVPTELIARSYYLVHTHPTANKRKNDIMKDSSLIKAVFLADKIVYETKRWDGSLAC